MITQHDPKTIEDEFQRDAGDLIKEKFNYLNSLTEILDKIDKFKKGDVYEIYTEELNKEYQRVFKEATQLQDAHDAKAKLDVMKGLAFALGVLTNLGSKMEEEIQVVEAEIENLREEK